MGMAKLNIWITDLGRPCEMAKRNWVVAISHCDGRVLEWCGKRYMSIPAECGHVELEVPPGCYVIRASAHTWWSHGVLFGNWATDRAVIQACCGDHKCVTLYAPSAQACSIPLFRFVIPTLVANGHLGDRALEAAKILQEETSQLPITDFEAAEAEMLEELFRETQNGDTAG